MRDAASAAAMSDPTMNRWFRRRWSEPPWLAPSVQPAENAVVGDDLAQTGLALLEEWRQRGQARVRP